MDKEKFKKKKNPKYSEKKSLKMKMDFGNRMKMNKIMICRKNKLKKFHGSFCMKIKLDQI